MKKLIGLTALILLLTASESYSQKTDTVCIPIKDAKRILSRVEQGKADSMELGIRKAEIVDLKALNTSQAMTIHSLDNQIEIMNLRLSNYTMQGTLYNEQIKALNKSLKKQKRRTAAAIIGGILVSGSLTYLLITK